VAIVPFHAFADTSRGGIVERHEQYAHAAQHHASCWLCRSICWLHSSMNLGSRS